MQGEAGHAKAAGDMKLIEHRIGADPAAQALSQNLRLFESSFGHENDEFVTSITSDNVGVAGLLLKQPANARQHEVTLKMSFLIIHSFELIEIDHHDGERTAGARSALPFRLQSFEKIAARFETGEAVGDRLVLHLLEIEDVL